MAFRIAFRTLKKLNEEADKTITDLEGKLSARDEALASYKKLINEMIDELYGNNFEVSGWHLNGDLESLDSWFEDNDWINRADVISEALQRLEDK